MKHASRLSAEAVRREYERLATLLPWMAFGVCAFGTLVVWKFDLLPLPANYGALRVAILRIIPIAVMVILARLIVKTGLLWQLFRFAASLGNALEERLSDGKK